MKTTYSLYENSLTLIIKIYIHELFFYMQEIILKFLHNKYLFIKRLIKLSTQIDS